MKEVIYESLLKKPNDWLEHCLKLEQLKIIIITKITGIGKEKVYIYDARLDVSLVTRKNYYYFFEK